MLKATTPLETLPPPYVCVCAECGRARQTRSKSHEKYAHGWRVESCYAPAALLIYHRCPASLCKHREAMRSTVCRQCTTPWPRLCRGAGAAVYTLNGGGEEKRKEKPGNGSLTDQKYRALIQIPGGMLWFSIFRRGIVE